jgi:hypothetical protein
MRRKKTVPIIQTPATAEFAVFTKAKPKVLQHIRFDSEQAATASLNRVMSRSNPEAGWFATNPVIHTDTRKDVRATQ